MEYKKKANKVIEEIESKGKIPIFVGGTVYYAKNMLWNGLISESFVENSVKSSSYVDISTEELFERLKKVDFEMSEKVHPEDRRKIVRSLEVFESHGEKFSELINKQKEYNLEEKPLLNALVLWLKCEEKEHESRLKNRIEVMMKEGLLDEADRFIKLKISSIDSNKGVSQAIGHKEFIPYFELKQQLKQQEKEKFRSSKVLEQCKEMVFFHHRRYAKSQSRVFKTMILGKNVPVVSVDTSIVELEQKKEDFVAFVKKVCDDFVDDKKEEIDKIKVKEEVVRVERHEQKKRVCEVCSKTLFGIQIEEHFNSRNHKKSVKRRKVL